MTHRSKSKVTGVIILIAVAAVMVFALSAPATEARMAKTRELFDSGVPRDASELLARYYKAAAVRMKAIVLNPPPARGGTQSGREFRQGRAAQQLQQVDTILRELNQRAGEWVGKNIPAAYREGLRRGEEQAKEAGVLPTAGPLEGSFSLIDRGAVVLLAQDTLADLHKAAESMGDRCKSVLRRTAEMGLSQAQLNDILVKGVIDGTPREAIRELRDELIAIHGETVTITDKNGDPMEFDAGYYASMVVRTKTREATVKARHNRLAERGLDLVAIVGRESDNACSAFLAMVFSLSGNHPKYPPYASLPGGGPPFHPNCSKSTRPFVEELASGRQLDMAEGLEDAHLLLNKDMTKAQRLYKDLQLRQQVHENYATTEKELFGPARGGGRRSAAG